MELNLSVEQIANLSFWHKLAILCIGFVLASFSTYYFIIVAQQQTLVNLQKEEKTSKFRYVLGLRKAATLKQELVYTEQIVDWLNMHSPPYYNYNILLFISDMEQLSAAHGVTIQELKPTLTAKATGGMPISLSLLGTYQALLSSLISLAKVTRLISIESATLLPTKKDKHRVSLKMKLNVSFLNYTKINLNEMVNKVPSGQSSKDSGATGDPAMMPGEPSQSGSPKSNAPEYKP